VSRSPLIDEFATTLRVNAVGTARAYPVDVWQFALSRGATSPSQIDEALSSATPSHVRQWVLALSDIGRVSDDEEARRKQVRRNRLITRKLAALGTFFRHQIAMERRKDNPADDIKRPPRSKPLPHVLNENEVTTLLKTKVDQRYDWLRQRDDAIMKLLYGSGVRRAEAVGLDMGSIDLEARTVHVTGKGSKDRVIPLSKPCVVALKAYLDVRPTRFGGKPKDDDIERGAREALFLSREGRRLSTRQLHTLFTKRKRASGITRTLTPHTMRHSCATHMIENGADVETVRQFLGHESLATTQIYTNVSQEHRKRVYEQTHPANRMFDEEDD
jgi:site-specific recombinase XerD